MPSDEKRPAPRAVFAFLVVIVLAGLCAFRVPAAAAIENSFRNWFPFVEFNGFWEFRTGCRTQEDPHEKEISVLETRLQAELYSYHGRWEFKYRGDVWADGITEQGEYDTREAWFFARPSDFLDVKIGRQVLTWGTGDLVFLNDLFPKDWQSYFVGRDRAYLKAPSDAAKISVFTDPVNMDVVYTPKFDPDRYITGEYLSHWHGRVNGLAGRNARVAADTPDRWFDDDELAVRGYRNIRNYELAVYGYWGFWKQPGGETLTATALFPGLNVYGASLRGQVGPGIGNVEIAYYRSTDDESGDNPIVDNSQMRYLIGYTQDLAKDCNANLQYYIEHMLDYDEYRTHLPGGPALDRDRHVVTLQLTKLLMNQNLELSQSSYYSPSDHDAYFRPTIRYKYTDKLVFEGGANIFVGKEPHTFFGQFKKNTNVFTSIRYDF